MPEIKQKKCVVICGPTASGKTSLAIGLASKMRSVVISADSMQIYRGMDIGTAKPSPSERKAVPHELIDICDPEESFSAARYKKLAVGLISASNDEDVLPFVVGGTGLYTDSIIFNTEFAEIPDSPSLRLELNNEYDALGGEVMLGKLRNIDPEAAAKLHPADKKRIVRAHEIFRLTGKTMTEHNLSSHTVLPDTDFLILVLGFSDRAELYRRINERVDAMIASGLEEEARALYLRGCAGFPTAAQAIGYKEFFSYFKGECSLCDAIELLKRRSRNYAKRQITWFKKYAALGAHFVEMSDPDSVEDARKAVNDFVPDRFRTNGRTGAEK